MTPHQLSVPRGPPQIYKVYKLRWTYRIFENSAVHPSMYTGRSKIVWRVRLNRWFHNSAMRCDERWPLRMKKILSQRISIECVARNSCIVIVGASLRVKYASAALPPLPFRGEGRELPVGYSVCKCRVDGLQGPPFRPRVKHVFTGCDVRWCGEGRGHRRPCLEQGVVVLRRVPKCGVHAATPRPDRNFSSNSVLWDSQYGAMWTGCIMNNSASQGGGVIGLLTSHEGEQGLIPNRAAPGFSDVRIMLDDTTGWWVFSGISHSHHPCIPALLHTHLASLTSALKTSMLRAAQISSLTHEQQLHSQAPPTLNRDQEIDDRKSAIRVGATLVHWNLDPTGDVFEPRA
ncbi:hypothetical protein PR048_032598 [Dryococelus australis]|uniref:Uncharacterized protein n=1 Tax=Dryococelus australis TaxID=614101 RepID=A0ABQ9G2N1_9NEOP|nr:hypothetical protein PR048_032598 [Dryococelus australis]